MFSTPKRSSATPFMPEINDEVLADKNEVAVEALTAKDRTNEPAKIEPTTLEFPNLP